MDSTDPIKVFISSRESKCDDCGDCGLSEPPAGSGWVGPVELGRKAWITLQRDFLASNLRNL